MGKLRGVALGLVQGLGLDAVGNLVGNVHEQIDVRPAELDPDIVDLRHTMRLVLELTVRLGDTENGLIDNLAGGRMVIGPQARQWVVTPSVSETTVTLSPRSIWWAEVPSVYVTSCGCAAMVSNCK